MKLSVIIPLYNEEESLNPLANEIRKALKPVDITYEIIFVDDGSVDTTAETMTEIAKGRNNIKILRHERNRGMGNAIKTG